MPDIPAIIQAGVTNPWVYLPLAVLLGALHALEPGHSKSVMAAFIVAIRGTAGQAVLLGLSAAISHSLIVWLLAVIGLSYGDKLIVAHAEPWLILFSGILIMALAARLLIPRRRHHHDHLHDHSHDHHHGHAHAGPAATFEGKKVTLFEIAWFGFTGGLLPCPAAVTVLLICLQIKDFTLGSAMVAAFSVGLAATLIAVGAIAAWGAKQARERLSGLSAWGKRLPLLSGVIILALGIAITIRGALMF